MGGTGARGRFPGRGEALSLWLRERPQTWVYLVGAACWGALILAPAQSTAAAFCLGGNRLADLTFAAGAALRSLEWPLALSHWLLMIGAMMLPMAAMAARHVAFRSFARRRARGMAGFLAGYAIVWLAVGPFYLAVGLLAHLGGAASPFALVAALGIAAAWQASPAKRRALRSCHRTVPLAPSGWRADRDCLVFGLAHGRSCLASCWALMLVPAAAGHHPLAMLLVALLALCERHGLSAEPLRSPAAAWAGLRGLLPSLVPTRVR